MLHRLVVLGPREDRARFRAAVEAEGSILAAHVPIPSALFRLDLDRANDMTQEVYGTCRRDRNPFVEADVENCGLTSYTFDLGAPHSYPPAGFLRVFAQYPDLRFYFERVPDSEIDEAVNDVDGE